jgi:hypothetical protein
VVFAVDAARAGRVGEVTFATAVFVGRSTGPASRRRGAFCVASSRVFVARPLPGPTAMVVVPDARFGRAAASTCAFADDLGRAVAVDRVGAFAGATIRAGTTTGVRAVAVPVLARVRSTGVGGAAGAVTGSRTTTKRARFAPPGEVGERVGGAGKGAPSDGVGSVTATPMCCLTFAPLDPTLCNIRRTSSVHIR